MTQAAPATNEPLSLTIRAVKESDFHFILSSWMQSYWSAIRHMRKADYFRGQQNLISELGTRRNIWVACDPETPDYVFGFSCGQKLTDITLMDYVYVKKMYRKRGVAKALCAKQGWQRGGAAILTHLTPHVRLATLGSNVSYNPYWNKLGYSDV